MPQTLHTVDMPEARAGLVADSGIVQDTISKLCEEAAGVHAGSFVVPGTDAENQAVHPTLTAEVSDGDGWGIVRYDSSKMPAVGAAALAAGNEYDDEEMLPIFSKGRIWVRCDDAAVIVANTPAFVRFVAGGGERLGDFREDADTADAVALPNCVFRSSHRDVNFDQAGTQRVALVEILLPTA